MDLTALAEPVPSAAEEGAGEEGAGRPEGCRACGEAGQEAGQGEGGARGTEGGAAAGIDFPAAGNWSSGFLGRRPELTCLQARRPGLLRPHRRVAR